MAIEHALNPTALPSRRQAEHQTQHVGIHLVVDAWKAPAKLLNDPDLIRDALTEAIRAGGATLIDMCVHQFSPHGVTATATLAESHVALHTWPEHGYFAADLFFCGKGNPYRAMESLKQALQAKQVKVAEIKRGFEPRVGVHAFAYEPT